MPQAHLGPRGAKPLGCLREGLRPPTPQAWLWLGGWADVSAPCGYRNNSVSI